MLQLYSKGDLCYISIRALDYYIEYFPVHRAKRVNFDKERTLLFLEILLHFLLPDWGGYSASGQIPLSSIGNWKASVDMKDSIQLNQL